VGAYGTTAYGAGGYGVPQTTLPPQPDKPKPWIWLVVLVVALAIAAGAIYLANRPGSPGSTPTPTPSRIRINSAQIGDCFDRQFLAGDSYAYIRKVDCNTSHDAEIIFVDTVDSATYPDEDEWSDYANNLCDPAFESYVGIAWDNSVFDAGYIFPDETSWNKSDHTLVCYVYNDDGPVTTPIKGSGR